METALAKSANERPELVQPSNLRRGRKSRQPEEVARFFLAKNGHRQPSWSSARKRKARAMR
jgi:hypothetical protein